VQQGLVLDSCEKIILKNGVDDMPGFRQFFAEVIYVG
jgi:hypothetical protein